MLLCCIGLKMNVVGRKVPLHSHFHSALPKTNFSVNNPIQIKNNKLNYSNVRQYKKVKTEIRSEKNILPAFNIKLPARDQ